MARRYDTVSLLTDYGWEDEFVGVVKSVLRDLAPHATAIDLTHGVRPFDVRGGSLALARAIPYVAEGVVVAVVDPGVGTARRAVAVEVAGGAGVLVGPDNGLLAPAVAIAGGAERAVELVNPRYQLEAPGSTFAGRDVFAPAAAHLCNEVDLSDLGRAIDPYALLPGMVPLPRRRPTGSTPRSCGSTASATASSTSAPRICRPVSTPGGWSSVTRPASPASTPRSGTCPSVPWA